MALVDGASFAEQASVTEAQLLQR